MQRFHESVQEALDSVQEALDDARQRGHFMVAVWSAENNGTVHLIRRTTWDFPTETMSAAVSLLQQDLAKEAMQGAEVPPLPKANLFDKALEGDNGDVGS